MKESPPTLLRRLFALWVHSVDLPASSEPLRHQWRDIVIVTPSRKFLIQAILDTFAQRLGIPSPEYAERGHGEGTLRWVSLNDTENLRAILDTNRTQIFVTMNIFARRGPLRNEPIYSFGYWSALESLFSVKSLVVQFGAPLQPTQRIHPSLSGESLLRRVQRQLRLDFYQVVRVVRGTPFQLRGLQEKLVLSGPDFERELAIVAAKSRSSKAATLRKARKEFRSIAANPIRPLYSFAAPLCRIITRQLFTEIITVGLDRFVETAKKHPVILVPMHRSHLDYILVSMKMYEANINPPLIAAGVNLRFFPIGFFIRSLGGYFVKRNARHDRIHALVLRRYVTYLVKRGHLQEFFIEGGRSRSGKMRAPKVGLLGIMVDAYLKGLRRDLLFVPVSISYENVVEDHSFGDENTGREKKQESLRGLVKARSIFGKTYGEVVISFGDPLAVSQIAGQLRGSGHAVEQRHIVTSIADSLTKQIRNQSSITFTALAYTALMAAPRYGMRRSDFITTIEGLARLATTAREMNPQIGPFTPALEQFLAGNLSVLDDITRGGVIHAGHALGEQTFFIPGEKRFTADFYKNSVLHLFVEPSLLALLARTSPTLCVDDARPYHTALQSDLLLPHWEVFRELLVRWEAALKREGLLRSEPQAEYGRSDAVRIATVLPNLIIPSLESMVWILDNLSWPTHGEPGRPEPLNELMAQLQRDFKSASYLGAVRRTESASQSALTSAFGCLNRLGALEIDESKGSAKSVIPLRRDLPELITVQRALANLHGISE